MSDKKIGFIGQGWIGRNYADDFERRGFDVVRYSLEGPHVNNGNEIKECDIVFIAVPTPTTPAGFDSSILREVVKHIGFGKTAVIKSTILPGTTEAIQAENPDIFVMHSPEFLTEATAAHDAANPMRNIMGIPVDNDIYRMKADEALAVLPYAPYRLVCSSREAELIKYGGNCWFYFKVIFINMLYDLSQKLDSRWEVVRDAMAADPRIGRTHLDPVHKTGRGAGGHCFIKDFAAFSEIYKNLVGDENGLKVLSSLKDKNIELLTSTHKDLDLLAGVYGQETLASDRKEAATGGRKPVRCLVTGGAGFIGSNLVDALIERGDEVVVIDNLSTGYRENLNPKAEFYNADLRDLAAIKPLFQGVDYVFHVAALARVQPSIEDPVRYNDHNVNATLNVLKAATDAGVKKVVYSASSSAYGDQEEMPLREDMPAIPLSPYGLQKYIGEEYCRLFSQVYKLPTVCLRYFNVFGPRMVKEGAYASVVAIFGSQRQAGKPLTVAGDGEQLRTYTYVKDIVRANILAAESGISDGRPINTGQCDEYSVNQIAAMFGGPIEKIPPRIEPRRNLCGNRLAKELLGWEPTVKLSDWIEEYKRELGIGGTASEVFGGLRPTAAVPTVFPAGQARKLRVLITGSSGEIGTNLALRLMNDGHEVFGVDARPNTWTKDVNTIIQDLSYSYRDHKTGIGNIAYPDKLDAVVHLAAHAKVHELVVNPSKSLENVMMLFNVLEFCRNNNLPMIHASSREVYGDIQRYITDEAQADVHFTESPYSASKISGEAYIYSYAKCYGLNYIVFRFSNVYGRYDNDIERMERVMPLFIRKIRNNEPLTVYGKDKMLDFTYVDDCTAGIARGIELLTRSSKVNQTINLAYGQGRTLVDMVNMIGAKLGRQPQMSIEPSRVGEVTHYVADIGKARKVLGYEPTTDLEKGIGKAVDWTLEWEARNSTI